MVPHRALTNFIRAMLAEPGSAPDDVLLAVPTVSFDIAGLEFFLPLVAGGRDEIAGTAIASDAL